MRSLWKSSFGVIGALVLLIVLPLLLRPASGPAVRDAGAEVLIIATPHNEATRYEFTRAFTEAHFRKTGRRVVIDWRTPGGASEIGRFLSAEYLGSFRQYWEKALGQPWSGEVEASFANRRVAPGQENAAARARQAFLESNVSCGMDLLFGGGSYDFGVQAAAGSLVDCGLLTARPDLFGPQGSIPQTHGGEAYWDAEGRWFGAALAAFGICANTDALARLGFPGLPETWAALADPRLRGAVALSDPTQSGSAAKAFEMLIQQQIHEAGGDPEEGWARAMRLIRRISANARYYTDAASKVPWDVESGDAAAGMAIDFYGRYQSEAVRRADGTSRMVYLTPKGGSSFGADGIGLLRGAPNDALAREFIAFVLSEEGQKLWNWKIGTPGGPRRYALRRLPVLPALYAPGYDAERSDPGVDPYAPTGFTYHPEWTGALFHTIGFVISATTIEAHEELREAWAALVENGFPPQATARFDSVAGIDYTTAKEVLRPALASGNRMDRVRLARTLGERFRPQDREAAELARVKK